MKIKPATNNDFATVHLSAEELANLPSAKVDFRIKRKITHFDWLRMTEEEQNKIISESAQQKAQQ